MGTFTRAQLLQEGIAQLQAAGIETPAAEARTLLNEYQEAEYRGRGLVPPTWPDPEVKAEVAAQFRAALAQRCQRVPLQLILGHTYFHSFELAVAPGVFIPRPETEWLAELALRYLREDEINHAPLLVDLCAGSGALGLVLAHAFPQARVVGIDLNPAAVQLANANAKRLGLRNYCCYEGDARSPMNHGLTPGSAQMVVTNPPYLLEPVTQPEALVDPELALYGGGELGLDLPIQILEAAAQLIAARGKVLMEHDPRQAGALRAAAAKLGFAQNHTAVDLTGTDRYLIATAD